MPEVLKKNGLQLFFSSFILIDVPFLRLLIVKLSDKFLIFVTSTFLEQLTVSTFKTRT